MAYDVAIWRHVVFVDLYEKTWIPLRTSSVTGSIFDWPARDRQQFRRGPLWPEVERRRRRLIAAWFPSQPDFPLPVQSWPGADQAKVYTDYCPRKPEKRVAVAWALWNWWRPVYTCHFWCDFWCDFAYKTRLTLSFTNVVFAKHCVDRKESYHILFECTLLSNLYLAVFFSRRYATKIPCGVGRGRFYMQNRIKNLMCKRALINQPFMLKGWFTGLFIGLPFRFR